MPYLTSAVVATEALLACADGGDLLEGLASGRVIGALAVGLHTAPGAAYATVRADGGTLHGELTGIADAAVADVLLVAGGRRRAVRGDGRRGHRHPADVPRPHPPLARVALDAAPAAASATRSPPYAEPCAPGRDCSPPSNSASPTGR